MAIRSLTLLASLPLALSVSACMHYPTGTPKVSEYLFCGRGFAVGYNFTTSAPDWVAYTISQESLERGDRPLTGRFHINRNIPERYQASPQDYQASMQSDVEDAQPHQPAPFIKGQLANPKAIQQNPFAHGQTYSMYSILPIRAGAAEKLWYQLTKQELALMEQRESLHIFTGGLYQNVERYHGKSGVAIPSHFWRVLYDPSVKKANAYLIPNEAELEHNSLEQYLTSIDHIEQLTELDLFNRLDDALEQALENNNQARLN